MDMINKINYEINKHPSLKKISSKQLPCQFCTEDNEARVEIIQVQNLLKDNTNFAKELLATYHVILHMDIPTALTMLYYKDIRNVVGIMLLAKLVDGRDGKGEENLIYHMCRDTINKRDSLAKIILDQPLWAADTGNVSDDGASIVSVETDEEMDQPLPAADTANVSDDGASIVSVETDEESNTQQHEIDQPEMESDFIISDED